MADTPAVASRGPIPGICCSRAQASSLLAIFSKFSLKLFNLQLQMFPLLPKKIQQAARPSIVDVLRWPSPERRKC
jgi:hypothetical protein